ncbi:proteobacterial dedicated sortase system histidine kinase [Alteromonas mediterranea]|uniref:histidine kinase n=1 Tax=Alteromonas mediterranea (strain DSM 17117 / CIP 110805 / LMG 28347 / Deep ecotype) TaxID=1774373 RepID=F2G676_ALTMD|nr:proteobacterial dedicated sortase system histidine kinase [Alteromonas mediterranea]AEA99820.1 sensor histidine kinase [Alteromonas mediterranea DE]MBR9898235.1 proteobacterial dedicated sortase system histidine kinase [Gammaproteobacteria bacterium]CAH1189304.1 Adaptive-response sensory-kinase SasA [Alteromonas mediterranea]|tara:strand:+ start:1019 stop:3187 length:2169 start_codon:yes stop_codon:yes gene_type:complete
MGFRFSIRLQLMVLSLFLFTIPYLGYNYVWELEQYLRNGQEQTMIGTARAVATALHERPALFDSQSAYLQDVRPGTDLYALPIPSPIRLDGELNDWQQVSELISEYDGDEVIEYYNGYDGKPTSLSFTHMVGRYGQFLYAMFEVSDDTLLWRQPNSLSVETGDHLLIGMETPQGELARYVVAPYESGWVNAYKLAKNTTTTRAVENALSIQGRWQETATGYNIELRFPLSMTTGGLAFTLVDVDNSTNRLKQYALGSANTKVLSELGTVITPSPEIERILAGLKYADSRVWVVDKHKRVLARAGDIQSATGIEVDKKESPSNPVWHWVESKWLLPLYYQILTRPPADFIDELDDAYALVGQDLGTVLNGQPESLWRLSPDNKAIVLSAAYPIFIEGNVMGAVIVEQTTNGIRTLRNRALEQLFHVILAVMSIGTLGLLLFATRISNRIRSLRDDTEAVIDDNGKIIGTLPASNQRDEIGDLSRSFADVLSRLQQYNSYLENMASRLSHELRTPIAVVKSSLDMLSHVNDTSQQAVFVERAQSGVNRLSTILNSMSEATRLEQAIAQEDMAQFNIVEVIQGCVEGYKHAYAQRIWRFSTSDNTLPVYGSAELVAQLFDKVISNAVDFSQDNDEIVISLEKKDKQVFLSVSNPGPLLPQGMKSQLTQSMVSVRKENEMQNTTHSPHLGLGLYIANMIANFHKGQLLLNDKTDGTGVIVTITFPL